ncbi:MAG TPA: RHS repeat-associated core domain-containing protein, partial [Bacteroidales bacterium]|nr:RHS repeat-associated core domain-containing protein [Bacteroidales bacterium]
VKQSLPIWGDLEGYYAFNAKELDEENNMYYYSARYYASPTFISRDPLMDEKPWLSPYHYCSNSPLNRVDPTGKLDNPIFDLEGNLLGTDDKGIQGEAIIMDKKDFKQGMSNKEALQKGTSRTNLPKVINPSILDKIDNQIASFPSRPDWDGYLTLSEANDWYQNGNGQPLFVDLNKIDLSGIVSLGEKFVGQKKVVNLLLHSGSVNDGLVYGKITLVRYPNHQVRAMSDTYDFDMKPWLNPLNWGRNIETMIGQKVVGQGKGYEINIYGSKKLKPILPWIK